MSPRESRRSLLARARTMEELLGATYPDAKSELDFDNAFQLLVATVLSAQSTDKRVNAVTPALFARYPDAAAMAAGDRAEIEELIHPVGFFRAKTDALLRLSAKLVEDFGGVVPASLDELVTLPGVGRKTANVVLGNALGVPGITPDTHFMRVTRRMGWTTETTPDAIEADVGGLFAPSEWTQVSHRVIWHGRRRCHARRPACGACPVSTLCPSFGEGETDPLLAATLVREPRG